ncbi:hypothetical protein AHAS_Ahas07G0114500 [Arachis hypogaea]
MKPPNGRKIVLRFNSALQPVGDEAGLLSGVMGLLGSDYTKFPICEKDRRKVHTKDKVYNECVKEMFHFEEDSRGIVKRIIFKMLGRAWKETRNRLYHHCYDSELSLEENIKNHPDRITTDHWRWFLDYRNSKETHSERQGKRVSRGELYLLTHKRANDSYVHDAAWTIGERIEAIEQHDESSRLLSQNDSLAQALGKEHPGRVRGMGLGPTSSQVFELAAEKLKRKIVEDEVAVEKTKRQAVEDGVAAEKIKRQTVEDEVAAGKISVWRCCVPSVSLLSYCLHPILLTPFHGKLYVGFHRCQWLPPILSVKMFNAPCHGTAIQLSVLDHVGIESSDSFASVTNAPQSRV